MAIVSHISPASLFSIMKLNGYAWLVAALLVMAAFTVGCTTTQAPAATQQPTVTAAPVTSTQVSAAAPVKTADIDTKISVRYNDYACLNIQQELGKEYLYPDEKYTLYASPAGVSGVNVNVLLVDENDSLGMRQIKPVRDDVQKKWVYEGIVPVAQFNDISSPVEKTFTIKAQSKYYICVDDRKESYENDVMLQVPVKLKRIP